MNFKKIDKHTPEKYWEEFKIVFENKEPRNSAIAFYGFMVGMHQDFLTICPNYREKPREYVREAVDYLDNKYTACIRYFHSKGWEIDVPETGYRHSLLAAFPDIAEIYGAEKQAFQGLLKNDAATTMLKNFLSNLS